jgi:uncharacterized protein (TIGR00375 family)
MFHADLHIHSRFSLACSRDCDVRQLAWWGLRKGVTVVGTGDFTHPAWAQELRETLVPAEPGLFRLGDDGQRQVLRSTPPSCARNIRFMLSAEISTIYRGDGRTRKVHHLLYAPTFEAADRITAALSKVGNLASDGRPILGLDSRHLLEITLDGGPGCYLVPAHAWTPWFAVLGSKSGFDAVADCYGDLAPHIFAIETGLSSDPPMNWTCSALDSYRLVSNSDAHSPPMLGREATTFATKLDYFSMAEALRTGSGLAGTIEFYPEEGKYHLDGHRKCGVRFTPDQSRDHDGTCPKCRKPLTIGVAHRVAELADRPAGYRPPGAPAFTNLVQLPQIVGEILGAGPKSKKVGAEVGRLVAALGPELGILCEIPVSDIGRCGGGLLAEAITRLRRGAAAREPGYDGEYGTVRLFGRDELERSAVLFDMARPDEPWGRAHIPSQRGPERSPVPEPGSATTGGDGGGGGGDLDPDQRSAVAAAAPLLIIAGPGTGKTRTLTHRIAHQILSRQVAPEGCLAITFTRRAAEELRGRLAALVPAQAAGITVTTFHGLGLMLLREHQARAGLPAGFQVADDTVRLQVAAQATGSARAGRRLLAAAATDQAARELLVQALSAAGLVDFDSLIELPVALLKDEPALGAALRDRWPQISVDEYQDIDAAQYRLLRLLAGQGRGLTVIGDPDQAIYGFRGADVSFFLSFARDYPGAATRQLGVTYRSSATIAAAALQAVAPATLVPGRALRAATPGPPISLHRAQDEQAEAAWIARAIDQLLGGASFHSLDSGRADAHGHDGLGLSDIAVLYRTAAQAGPLGQALTRAGLPFQKRSHDALVRRTGVAEIVREMRLASPGDATGRQGGADHHADAVADHHADAVADHHADAVADHHADAVADRLRQAVRTVAARAPRSRAGGQGTVAVDALAAGEVLAPLARRCGADLERFLTEISLGAEADAIDPRADAITLLTLHAAKGLEFEVVFLAGCEKDLLPLWLPGATVPGAGPGATVPGAGPSPTVPGVEPGAALPAAGPGAPVTRATDPAEERRLLFVGMTRARSRLFLTCASRRTRHGASRDTGPSPFLAAIDPGLLVSSGQATSRRPAERQLRLL